MENSSTLIHDCLVIRTRLDGVLTKIGGSSRGFSTNPGSSPYYTIGPNAYYLVMNQRQLLLQSASYQPFHELLHFEIHSITIILCLTHISTLIFKAVQLSRAIYSSFTIDLERYLMKIEACNLQHTNVRNPHFISSIITNNKSYAFYQSS